MADAATEPGGILTGLRHDLMAGAIGIVRAVLIDRADAIGVPHEPRARPVMF